MANDCHDWYFEDKYTKRCRNCSAVHRLNRHLRDAYDWAASYGLHGLGNGADHAERDAD